MLFNVPLHRTLLVKNGIHAQENIRLDSWRLDVTGKMRCMISTTSTTAVWRRSPALLLETHSCTLWFIIRIYKEPICCPSLFNSRSLTIKYSAIHDLKNIYLLPPTVNYLSGGLGVGVGVGAGDHNKNFEPLPWGHWSKYVEKIPKTARCWIYSAVSRAPKQWLILHVVKLHVS